MTIKLNFSITRKDFILANIYLYNIKTVEIISFVAALLFAIPDIILNTRYTNFLNSTPFIINQTAIDLLLSTLITFFIWFVFFFIVISVGVLIGTTFRIFQTPSFKLLPFEVYYEFSQEKLLFQSPNVTSILDWQGVVSAEKTKKFFYISTISGQKIYIPVSILEKTKQLEPLKAILQEKNKLKK